MYSMYMQVFNGVGANVTILYPQSLNTVQYTHSIFKCDSVSDINILLQFDRKWPGI